MKILNLLLGMSYDMTKRVGYKFQSPSIKIEDVSHDGVREKAMHRTWPFGPAKNAKSMRICSQLSSLKAQL